jgi:hypothetical protein
MTNLDMLLKVLYDDCDRNGDKNVCEILIFRPPTVRKLTGETVGGREGGWRKDSKVGKRLLPVRICVGDSWFYLNIFKIFIINTS